MQLHKVTITLGGYDQVERLASPTSSQTRLRVMSAHVCSPGSWLSVKVCHLALRLCLRLSSLSLRVATSGCIA